MSRPGCERARERLLENAGRDAHLEECPDCRSFARALGRIDGILAGTEPSPTTVPARLHARVMRRVVDHRERRARRGVVGALAVLAAGALAAGVAIAVGTWGAWDLQAPSPLPLLEAGVRILSEWFEAEVGGLRGLPAPSPRATILGFAALTASGISLLLDRLARET